MINSEGLSYENIEVLYDMSGDFTSQMKIQSTPTNIFLGSDGQVARSLPGALPSDMIDEIVAEIN